MSGEVRCLICGRLLTAPKSVKRGIGPVCLARLLKEYKTEEAEN